MILGHSSCLVICNACLINEDLCMWESTEKWGCNCRVKLGGRTPRHRTTDQQSQSQLTQQISLFSKMNVYLHGFDFISLASTKRLITLQRVALEEKPCRRKNGHLQVFQPGLHQMAPCQFMQYSPLVHRTAVSEEARPRSFCGRQHPHCWYRRLPSRGCLARNDLKTVLSLTTKTGL